MQPDLSADLKAALATIVAAEARLPPDYVATFHQALLDLARLAEQQADAVIAQEAGKVPLLGKFIANAVISAVNAQLEAGVADLAPPAQGT